VQEAPAATSRETVRDLAGLIERVREHELKYRNLETFIRRTGKFVGPEISTAGAVTETQVKVHTVMQGDLAYCQIDETTTRARGNQQTHERVSSYDGERTRSVEYGNSANIHVGRYESADAYPPHCWALFPQRVSFALSSLLGGTTAVQKDSKVRHYPRDRQSFFEFNRVENELAGEELVDDYRCVKVVCRYWSSTEGKDPPVKLLIWLAIDRNYLCIKSQTVLNLGNRELRFRESKVETLREVTPGLWLPSRVSASRYNVVSLRAGQQVPEFDDTLVLHKAIFNPERPVAFFRDVKIPDDILVFEIENGRLAGRSFRDVPAAANSRARLAEIVEKVTENEALYSNIAVTLQKEYRHSESNRTGVAMLGGPANAAEDGSNDFSAPVSTREERISLAQNGKTWYSQRRDDLGLDGAVIRTSEELEVGDGEWLRKSYQYSGAWPENRPPSSFATIKIGGFSGAAIHRPHALFERDYKSPRPLSELLTSKWEDENNGYAMEVQYLGEDDRNGHPCEVVSLRTMIPPTTGPYYIRLLWLAKDRNYLPIRMEGHEPAWSSVLPTGLITAGDLREIAPGVWFPYRQWSIAFKKGSEGDLAAGRLAVLHRTDYRVQKVELNPKVPSEKFSEFTVPAGTQISVQNATGRPIGRFVQESMGTPGITRERYRELIEESKNQTEK
jgi:hypothetical protein